MTEALSVIGGSTLAEQTARARVGRRVRRRLTTSPGHLLLHPIWVARVEVVADRPPFPPRVRAAAVFVDAVSGYRGLVGDAPRPRQVRVEPAPADLEAAGGRLDWVLWGEERVALHRPVVDQDRALELVGDVQRRQIDRSYALRKPRHRIVDVGLHHLPLWRLPTTDGAVATVNAVTGADESYLASRW